MITREHVESSSESKPCSFCCNVSKLLFAIPITPCILVPEWIHKFLAAKSPPLYLQPHSLAEHENLESYVHRSPGLVRPDPVRQKRKHRAVSNDPDMPIRLA